MSYLFWSIIVLLLILGASVLSNYGKSFIDDKTFSLFFGWYSGLVLINLFIILLNLVYHYFMKDLQGPRGLKGEVGDRGPPGKDDKCGCGATGATGVNAGSIDAADKIKTIIVTGKTGADDIKGSMIVNEGDVSSGEIECSDNTQIADAAKAELLEILKESLVARLTKSISNIEDILNEKKAGVDTYNEGKQELIDELEALIVKINTAVEIDDALKIEVDKAIIRPFYFDMNSVKYKEKGSLLKDEDTLRSYNSHTIPHTTDSGSSYMFQIEYLKKSINTKTGRRDSNKERENYFHIKVADTITVGQYYGQNYQAKAKRIILPGVSYDCYPAYQVFYDLENKKLKLFASVSQEIKNAANAEIEEWNAHIVQNEICKQYK